MKSTEPSQKKKRVLLMLTEGLLSWLDNEALRQTASRSLIVRQAIARLQAEHDAGAKDSNGGAVHA